MKRIFSHLVLLGLLMLSTQAFATIKVVTTVPDFGSIAKAVGGDLLSITTLVKPTQDPHFVDAKPSLLLALNQADLLLTAGMELEAGWLPPLISGARNSDILKGGNGYLECGTLIEPMEVRKVNRAEGDIHPGGNPHFWIDPRNGVAIAKGIASKLAAIDPDNKAAYTTGLEKFLASLKTAMSKWQQQLAPLKGTSVVVYHESWVYFLDWAGLKQVGSLEPKPGIPPTPSHVATLIRQVSTNNVKFMMQESFYPTSLSKLFASKSGATLKILPTMTGARGTRTYIELIEYIVEELIK